MMVNIDQLQQALTNQKAKNQAKIRQERDRYFGRSGFGLLAKVACQPSEKKMEGEGLMTLINLLAVEKEDEGRKEEGEGLMMLMIGEKKF